MVFFTVLYQKTIVMENCIENVYKINENVNLMNKHDLAV